MVLHLVFEPAQAYGAMGISRAIRNKIKLGQFKTPELFHNNNFADLLRSDQPFQPLTIPQLKAQPRTYSRMSYLYAITADGNIFVSREDSGINIHHPDLTRGKPVICAGHLNLEMGDGLRISTSNHFKDYANKLKFWKDFGQPREIYFTYNPQQKKWESYLKNPDKIISQTITPDSPFLPTLKKLNTENHSQTKAELAKTLLSHSLFPGHQFSENIRVQAINEATGHFRCRGSHLPSVVEHIFADHFEDAIGKFHSFRVDGAITVRDVSG